MSQSVATPRVDLDQQTKDELQPPCDYRVFWFATGWSDCCPQPATWACLLSCEHCGGRQAIECDVHMQMLAEGRLSCRVCQDAGRDGTVVRLISAEPLR